jgi:alpha-mannosidase
MEQFPDYHFSQSQPYLYEVMRQEAPDLFAAIQEQVKNGRWEPLGGMWVEADCNISGSEALARQFLLGRSYLPRPFRPRRRIPRPLAARRLWLRLGLAPTDQTGRPRLLHDHQNRLEPVQPAALRLLLVARAGRHARPDPLLHHARRQRLGQHLQRQSHRARELLGTWHNFQQKEAQQELLMIFGYGDGGGGPTREMQENLREMAHFPALPRARQASVAEFFQTMEAGSGDHLPTWNGELYLEMHRGTYTTQSRTKRHNRRSEFLLHDAEFLAALAAWLDESFAYPHEQLRRAWRLVCLNQFHDILPGSSIAPVYVDAETGLCEVAEIGTAVCQQALTLIQQQVGGDLLVVNPTSFTRQDLAFWPQANSGWPGAARRPTISAGRRPFPTHPNHPDGTWIALGTSPPTAPFRCICTPAHRLPPVGLSAAPDRLENNLILIELNEAGDISRIYDKLHDRELLPPGAVANQLQAFEDRPLQWDAWDIDSYFEDRMDTAEPAAASKSLPTVRCGPPLRLSDKSAAATTCSSFRSATTAPNWTSTPASTGRSGTRCSRSPSPWRFWPRPPPMKSSGATWNGRPTATPVGIGPGLRPAPRSGSI